MRAIAERESSAPRYKGALASPYAARLATLAIVARLRPRDRGHQTAVLAALVRDGDLTSEEVKDLLFAILMDEIGVPVRISTS